MRISDWSSDVCSSDLAEDIDDGIDVLTPLIGHTLTVALPEGVRLADVPTSRRRAAMEFQFALAPTRVDALLALLHRHGLLTARQGSIGRASCRERACPYV